MTTRDDLRTVLAEALEGAARALRANVGTDLTAAVPDPMPVGPTERLALSVTEAAEVLGVSRGTMYELLNGGQVRSVQIGRRRLIPVAALQEVVSG